MKYCHLDVESPLILHAIYDSMPILTKLVNRLEQINIGDVVDIMPSRKTVSAIAQGRVCQISGNCEELSNLKIKKDQLVIKVEKIFDPDGIIHYPHSHRSQK